VQNSLVSAIHLEPCDRTNVWWDKHITPSLTSICCKSRICSQPELFNILRNSFTKRSMLNTHYAWWYFNLHYLK